MLVKFDPIVTGITLIHNNILNLTQNRKKKTRHNSKEFKTCK